VAGEQQDSVQWQTALERHRNGQARDFLEVGDHLLKESSSFELFFF
jgi:hypothetical protein